MDLSDIIDELTEHESQPQSCLRMDRVLTEAVRALAIEVLDLKRDNVDLQEQINELYKSTHP